MRKMREVIFFLKRTNLSSLSYFKNPYRKKEQLWHFICIFLASSHNFLPFSFNMTFYRLDPIDFKKKQTKTYAVPCWPNG